MMRSRGPSILLLIVIFQLFFDVQGYGWICWWRFNCRSTFNANALQRELNEKLYGQPFVISTVVQALSAHYSSGARPKRALSLSFHGPSGTGKNFVSTIVANNVLCRGIEDTRYTYKIWLGQNFASPSQVQRNKDHIKNFIEERVAQCKYQIFIFDEVDKYHPGVLDVLKQYMEGFVVNDLDFNYAVFIFLTNAGGNEIEKLASEKHKAGITRDKLKVSDFMPLIKNSVYKDTSGGWSSSVLIKNNMIGYFIAFLPLGQKQVKECIMAAAHEKGYPELAKNYEFVEKIAKYVEWTYHDGKRMFSTSGCKGVDEYTGNEIEAYKMKGESRYFSDEL